MSQTVNTLFDIKSASLDLLALTLKTTDMDAIQAALASRFALSDDQPPEGFVIDLEPIADPSMLALDQLLLWLKQHNIKPVALRHPNPQVAAMAAQHGLFFLSGDKASARISQPVADSMIIDRPVRAGQQVYAKGSHLVVLAMVSAGAELIADGSIHVYAPLRGRALAGARGHASARIFTQSMEAELVSIAGVYRTIEQALPDSIRGKPTQIFLESERLVMTALGA